MAERFFDNAFKTKVTLVLFTCHELDQFQGIITERTINKMQSPLSD
jgi:hypothetical protein